MENFQKMENRWGQINTSRLKTPPQTHSGEATWKKWADPEKLRTQYENTVVEQNFIPKATHPNTPLSGPEAPDLNSVLE